MTAPDLIHLWPRAGDPNSGQWVGVTAPETTLAFTANGPTLESVRKAASDLITHIRYVTPKGAPSTSLMLAERLERAMKQIGGE